MLFQLRRKATMMRIIPFMDLQIITLIITRLLVYQFTLFIYQ